MPGIIRNVLGGRTSTSPSPPSNYSNDATLSPSSNSRMGLLSSSRLTGGSGLLQSRPAPTNTSSTGGVLNRRRERKQDRREMIKQGGKYLQAQYSGASEKGKGKEKAVEEDAHRQGEGMYEGSQPGGRMYWDPTKPRPELTRNEMMWERK